MLIGRLRYGVHPDVINDLKRAITWLTTEQDALLKRVRELRNQPQTTRRQTRPRPSRSDRTGILDPADWEAIAEHG